MRQCPTAPGVGAVGGGPTAEAAVADRRNALEALPAEAGRIPHDRALSGLIGELATRSETFRTWWAAHNVRLHCTGVKHLDPGPPRRSLPVSGLPVLSQQSGDG